MMGFTREMHLIKLEWHVTTFERRISNLAGCRSKKVISNVWNNKASSTTSQHMLSLISTANQNEESKISLPTFCNGNNHIFTEHLSKTGVI